MATGIIKCDVKAGNYHYGITLPTVAKSGKYQFAVNVPKEMNGYQVSEINIIGAGTDNLADYTIDTTYAKTYGFILISFTKNSFCGCGARVAVSIT